MTDRRSFLAGSGAGLILAAGAGSAAFSADRAAGPGRFVLVILRGALDGLAAVAPLADPRYRDLRGALALPEAGAPGGVLPVAHGFGLHPALPGLAARWQAGELAVLHACATPYRDRSHFDGQDVLEGGTDRLFARTGWLGRALALRHGAAGIALARSIPLVLRGTGAVSSWAPGVAQEADGDTLARLMDLYAGDSLLGPALARAVETDRIADAAGGVRLDGRGAGRRGTADWTGLGTSAARLLAAPGGPSAAVIGLDGWDTHANQGASTGLLAGRLGALDRMLEALAGGLGPHWTTTAVVVATEFGRTVRVNGTGGTDHGTGGVAFGLGGAFRGRGGLTGDWPGLARLHEDRDLTPANDIRTLFAHALELSLGLARQDLMRTVFT